MVILHLNFVIIIFQKNYFLKVKIIKLIFIIYFKSPLLINYFPFYIFGIVNLIKMVLKSVQSSYFLFKFFFLDLEMSFKVLKNFMNFYKNYCVHHFLQEILSYYLYIYFPIFVQNLFSLFMNLYLFNYYFHFNY